MTHRLDEAITHLRTDGCECAGCTLAHELGGMPPPYGEQ